MTAPTSTTAAPGRPTAASYDPAPLLARMDPTLTDGENAIRFGVSAATIRAWRHGRRRVSAAVADRIALELDLHPVLLWLEFPGGLEAPDA